MLDFFLAMKPEPQTVIILSLVIVFGMFLGKIKIFGVSIGIGGVLFAGLFGGHILSWAAPMAESPLLNRSILEFLREFGLVLFVYTIGMQVGPGFLASFKRDGMFLNLLAASIVLLGVLTAGAIHFINPTKYPVEVTLGILAGATTNTPGLGAGQQVLADIVAKKATAQGKNPQASLRRARESSSMGYAVAYPFGIVGIILSMIGLRVFFKLNPVKSANNFAKAQGAENKILKNVNLVVNEEAAIGLMISDLAKIAGTHTIISRHRRHEMVEVAKPDTKLVYGDMIHAIGPEDQIERLRKLTGPDGDLDLRNMNSDLVNRRILVTEKAVLGKTVESLNLHRGHGVTITRVTRSGVDFPPGNDVRLLFGDILMAVGPAEAVKQVAKLLGDCIQQYNHPLLVPMFIGIALGAVLGNVAIPLGLPVPLKLGLAGGPLVVALILSRFGQIGKFIFHIPAGANLWVRELGIVLFLACVGLMSGGKIVETLVHGDGLSWALMGIFVTLLPIILVGYGARFFFKTNYMQLCGLLAGSMTDPPALAFASGIANSEGPAITYASVYPMVMLLRILTCQLFVSILSQFS